MKLKTNYTEEREVEIVLPFFRMQKSNYDNGWVEYRGVLPDETYVNIFNTTDHSTIRHLKADRAESEVLSSYKTWQEITEAEFLEAHQKALDSLSLVPKLVDDIPGELFQQSENGKEIDKGIESELIN